MDRSPSTHRLSTSTGQTNDSDHNNNSLLTNQPETDTLKTTRNSMLNEAATNSKETSPGTILVADFLRERPPSSVSDGQPGKTGPNISITLRRQSRSTSYLPKMKSVYLSTIDYVQSKTADRFIFFTFLFIIIAFILIWFINKQCLFFGLNDTSRVCQVTQQLSNALSLGKHSSRSSSQRWPVHSQLTSSSHFTASNRTLSSSYRSHQSVLDPLFSWFFSHYEE